MIRRFAIVAEQEKEEKKLIIDEDWKVQAKKEKDLLAEQERFKD